MDNAHLDHASRSQRRTPGGKEPIVHRDGNRVSLQFQIGEIQSEMLVDDPVFLALPYTRTMIDFMLCHRNPTHIVMIGLGGGSIPKWCHREMPAADITVIEIDPQVIALRDRFHIPPDDHRFRVIYEDGADYIVARAPGRIEALLVDGFDIYGQSPQLCSQAFYDDCHRALTPDGVLIVNLCGPESAAAIEYIRRSFEDRVLVASPEDSENKIVLAAKGEHRWMGEEPDELMKKLRLHLWHAPTVRISTT